MALSPSTILANNLRFPGFISVGTYRAKGDGVTDDRVAIQGAIDAASVLCCTLYFPPGTYMVSRAPGQTYCLSISGSNIKLQGATRQQSIIMAQAALPAQTSTIFGNLKSNI